MEKKEAASITLTSPQLSQIVRKQKKKNIKRPATLKCPSQNNVMYFDFTKKKNRRISTFVFLSVRKSP